MRDDEDDEVYVSVIVFGGLGEGKSSVRNASVKARFAWSASVSAMKEIGRLDRPVWASSSMEFTRRAFDGVDGPEKADPRLELELASMRVAVLGMNLLTRSAFPPPAPSSMNIPIRGLITRTFSFPLG